jgi:hypothetical protein
MRFHRILPLLLLLAYGGALLGAEDRGVRIVQEGASRPLAVGRQYLVVIAVSNYQQWAPLASPVKDAREIKDILVSRYRIDRLYELYDEQATKANILRLLVRLQEEIQLDDSLLILYSGHGHLDRSSNTGFWIPVNAGTEVYEQQNWVPHLQLRGLLANIRATHLFVISDSCFAGDLIQATRSLPDTASNDFLQEAYSHVCRQVLTSGAAETVPDVSDFAVQLKSILRRNQNPCLDTFTLYSDIRLGVSGSVPLLGSLAGTGHQEGASFLLFLRPDLARPREEWAPPGAAQPGRTEAAPKTAGHFSAAVGLGAAFPVAEVAGVLQNAPVLWTAAHYNFSGDWGSLGLGLLAGGLWSSSDPSIASSYRIGSYPVALELRYRTRRARASLTVGLAAGAAFNRIRFADPALQEISTAKLMLLPSLGIGFQATRRFQLVTGARFLLILFDNNPYTGLSPEIGVEYAF